MKRKIEKIEDAEIITSKEEKDVDRVLIEKLKKLRTQGIIFCTFFFIALFMIFGLLIYNEYNQNKETINFQRELKTLTSEITFEFLDNELDDRELQVQKKTIILIDQAVKSLEKIFMDRLNLVTDKGDNRKVIKSLENEVSKFKLWLIVWI